MIKSDSEITTLGGGCFWCLEAVFEQVVGVESVVSGYSGGHLDSPSYVAVCNGGSGHAEVVRIVFHPQQSSFRQILEVFFAIHDPTTLNRQGNDVGTQYRSAIFTHTAEQAEMARALMAELTAEAVFDAPIVTEVTAAAEFWPAEEYHRNYFARHPNQPYCSYVVSPKVAKFRKKFGAWMRG